MTWQEMGLHQLASTKPITQTVNAPVVQTLVHAQHSATGCYHFDMYIMWSSQVVCLYEALVQGLITWVGTGFEAHLPQR